jgi:hypothetical protein
MFETQNDFDLFMLDFIRSTGGRYMICLGLDIPRPRLSTWMLTIWHI